MATSGDSDVFNNAIQLFAQQVIDLGRFWHGAVLGHEAREELSPGVLSDPHSATVGALEYLSQTVAGENGGPAALNIDEGTSSRLLEAGLVNILFACLPDPEAFERARQDARELIMVYNGFKEFIAYLSIAVGRVGMENICDDPLLRGLFSTVDRAVAPSVQKRPLNVWKDELRHLAWDTRVNAKASTHKPLTARLLEYLRWDIRGRKDEFCTVEKAWPPVDAEIQWRASQRDVTRPLSDLSHICANCSAPGAKLQCLSCQPKQNNSQAIGAVYCTQACRNADSAWHATTCQELRDLSRRALLFQITFVQYLLSVKCGTTFAVVEEDGVVKCFQHNLNHDKTFYVGVSPDLDLSLPKVETALHGFHCCDIKVRAKVLLDFFFRRSCLSIQFLNFIPKNAHTPLEVKDTVWFKFNMSTLHTVALLTTQLGHRFILDPTAAQFGWKEQLVAWETYVPSRLDSLHSTEVCGFQRPRTPTEHTRRPEKRPGRDTWTSKVVAEDVLEIAEANFMKNGGLDGVLKLPEAQFDEQCSKLKESLRSEMVNRDRSRLLSKE